MRGSAPILVTVAHRDGHVDVGSWADGPRLGPTVVAARRNLPIGTPGVPRATRR